MYYKLHLKLLRGKSNWRSFARRNQNALLVSLVITVLIGSYVYLLTKFQFRAETSTMERRMYEAIFLAQEKLGRELHDTIDEIDASGHTAFVERRKVLDQIAERFHLQFLWTVLKTKEGIMFTSTNSRNTKSGDAPRFRTFVTATTVFDSAFSTHLPQLTEFANAWGSGLMLVVPSHDWDDHTYAIAASVSHDQYDEILIGSVVTALKSGVLYIAFSGALGFLIFSLLRFIQPSRDNDPTALTERLLFAFRQIEEVSNVGGWIYKVEDDTVYGSESVFKLHNLPPDKVLSFEDAIKPYAPKDQVRIRNYLENCIRDQLPFSDKLEYRSPDGETKIIMITGSAVTNREGKTVLICGTTTDVTQSEILEQTSLGYQKLLEYSDALLAITDEQGKITTVNESAAQLADLKVGQPITEFLDKPSQEMFSNEIAPALRSGGVWTGTFGYLSGTSQQRYAKGSILQMENRGKKRLWILFQDVTELKTLNEQSRAILESFSYTTLIVNRANVIEKVYNETNLEHPITGRELVEVSPEEYKEETVRACESAFRGENTRVFHQHKRGANTSYYRARYNYLNENQIMIIVEDVTEFQVMLNHNRALLAEVNHRVKNNFQIMSSLISLSIANAANEVTKGELKSVQNRIFAMSLVHSMLQELGQGEHLDINAHLERISSSVASHLGRKVDWHSHSSGEELLLDQKTCMFLGLIHNELISNSIKHCDANQPLAVCFGVERQDTQIHYFYRDNGPYYQSKQRPISEQGLGVEIISLLVESIHGTEAWQSVGKINLTRFTNGQDWGKNDNVLSIHFPI